MQSCSISRVLSHCFSPPAQEGSRHVRAFDHSIKFLNKLANRCPPLVLQMLQLDYILHLGLFVVQQHEWLVQFGDDE